MPKNTRVAIFGITIFLVGFLTRAAFLQRVDQVVFDEVHFGKFISSYCCTHQRFFDIHPPVGKLIIAAGAYMGGYTGDFSFETIGQEYGKVPIQRMRMTVAFFGALLPVVIFILLVQVGVSLPFSFVGAFAVALDNAFVVESRFILTDSILLTATFGALACAFAGVRSHTTYKGWIWLILAGVCSGVAVGTKFTGLIAGALVVGMLVFEMLKQFLSRMNNPVFLRREKRFAWLLRIFLVILIAIAVYICGWMLHFSLLTEPGSGDVWGIPTGNFWKDLRVTQRQMVSANYNLTASHPYGSAWWSWPFMIRSVFYWQGENNSFIYLLGNPVVWWGSVLLLIVGGVTMCVDIARGSWKYVSRLFSSGAYVFVVGYLLAFIPLMRVPRVLFLYHYLTPLLFSLLFGMWWFDIVCIKNKRTIAIGACVVILAGFLLLVLLRMARHCLVIGMKPSFLSPLGVNYGNQ